MIFIILYFNIGTNTISRLVRNLHEGSIFSICVLKNGNIITGGGKDGRILHFDSSLSLTGEEAQVSWRSLIKKKRIMKKYEYLRIIYLSSALFTRYIKVYIYGKI